MPPHTPPPPFPCSPVVFEWLWKENPDRKIYIYAWDIIRLGGSANFTYVKYSGGKPHVARQLDKYLFSKSIVVSPIKSFLLPKS